jgi:hypothetical protein
MRLCAKTSRNTVRRTPTKLVFVSLIVFAIVCLYAQIMYIYQLASPGVTYADLVDLKGS